MSSPHAARPAPAPLSTHVPASEWTMLGLLSVLWGGSFFFYKVLAPVVPPFTLVLGRLSIAATALGVVLAWRGEGFALRPRLVGFFLLLGILNCALPFCLFAWSERQLSSGMAALLNAPTPIVTALVAHVATHDERLSRRTLLGALCGFAGVAVLMGPSLGGMSRGTLLPQLACCGATLSYSFGGVLARRVRGLSPLQMATGQMTGGALVVLPLAALLDRFWTLPVPPPTGWAALLGIGLLSTAAAYLMYFRILASSGATRAALVTFLVPISALAMGWLILGEPILPRDGPAILLIGLGLAVIDGRVLRLLRRPLPV